MSKADYLKKYLSSDATESTKDKKKKRKKIKKRANLAIHDDDVDWKTLIPTDQPTTEEEDEPDEAPQVVGYKDDTKIAKWQPVVRSKNKDSSPSRWKKLNSPDLSPPRRTRQKDDSDNDLSPPRKRKNVRSERQTRKRRASRSPEVVEIVERRRKSSDSSPPRRKRHDSVDESPPRKKRHDSLDSSPPRRRRHDSDVDQSPPRRKELDSKSPNPKRSPLTSKSTNSSKEKMSSGAAAGLQNAQALKEENAMVRKRQDEFFKSLDPSMSGRHAETVYRDKHGKKVDPKMEKLLQREKEKEMEEENERFMKWGRGAAQSKSHEEKLQDDLYEMSKPLARYADDEDLEKMLKERERAGDPMLAYLKKPVSKGTTKKGKTRKQRPTYKGAAPPNRFNIRPGYRWDGVNRSNGYEKTLFARESNKVAIAEEAYKWSVEDM